MGFFDRLRAAVAGGPAKSAADGRNFWFEARCAGCGELLHGRVDMYNELSLRDDAPGYIVRKTLIGSQRCYRPIEVTFYFDTNRQLTKREIRGGEFVDDEPDQAA